MRLDLEGFLAAHGDELVEVRRHLHARPELGDAEHETTALVSRRLAAAGLEPTVLSSGTGVVCDVAGARDGPVVALRADIDALPLHDLKDVPYRSVRPGICHACGHDVHTAILLGAALALAERRADLRGTVRCVFQPAEELTSGALDVLADGVLDGVSAVFALHCDPRLETGRLAVRVGPITGAASAVEVVLHGPGGHTARPHLTADLVYVVARVVTDLPAGLSRLADPRAGISLVFGMVSAGTAGNVIPGTAVARGTLRTLDREAWDEAPKLIERLLEASVSPFGVSWELNYRRGTPPVVNEAGATAVLTQAAVTALGTGQVVEASQSLGGEDFAWYLEQIPGCMARLGVDRSGLDADLHSGAFDADEGSIAVGVRALAQTAVDALRRYRATG
ncbi:MAG TPA: amidohydrolase [Actinomycetes bacterium]|nr:amidohydrolase [Actinomycetes bacterium]